jgi:hypothetical protein
VSIFGVVQRPSLIGHINGKCTVRRDARTKRLKTFGARASGGGARDRCLNKTTHDQENELIDHSKGNGLRCCTFAVCPDNDRSITATSSSSSSSTCISRLLRAKIYSDWRHFLWEKQIVFDQRRSATVACIAGYGKKSTCFARIHKIHQAYVIIAAAAAAL